MHEGRQHRAGNHPTVCATSEVRLVCGASSYPARPTPARSVGSSCSFAWGPVFPPCVQLQRARRTRSFRPAHGQRMLAALLARHPRATWRPRLLRRRRHRPRPLRRRPPRGDPWVSVLSSRVRRREGCATQRRLNAGRYFHPPCRLSQGYDSRSARFIPPRHRAPAAPRWRSLR